MTITDTQLVDAFLDLEKGQPDTLAALVADPAAHMEAVDLVGEWFRKQLALANERHADSRKAAREVYDRAIAAADRDCVTATDRACQTHQQRITALYQALNTNTPQEPQP